MGPRRLHSSYRSRRPARTLAVAEALMPRLGISRVTDITRLDRLGLPVFASVRPRSATLRVHAGKGLEPEEAKVGALMEAIEYAAAEPQNSTWEARVLSIAEFVARFGGGVDLIDFAPRRGVPIAPRDRLPVVDCEDLVQRRRVAVPAELVFVPYRPDGLPTLFGTTTNGLASGNSLVEATLHGLLEVLERDAVSMNRPNDVSTLVPHAALPQPFRALASRWRELGVTLAVRHVPNALSLPCFEAFLHEAGGAHVNLTTGSGLHLERDIALARAVCEAAQARLSHIHGGRDDITRFFAKHARGDGTIEQLEATWIERLFDARRTTSYEALPDEPAQGRPLTELLDGLLARMARTGFGSVCRYRFRLDLGGLHVVKLVVPKCEVFDVAPARIGPRLWAQVLRHV